LAKGFGTHLDDERLERYSMGALPHDEVELLEDHLLACRECQASVIADYRHGSLTAHALNLLVGRKTK
jgi:hypothetical protein